MGLYTSARALQKSWLIKRWKKYSRNPCLEANAFRLSCMERFTDSDRYLYSTANFYWPSSFEWRHHCLIFTQSLGRTFLFQSRGRSDFPRFCTALEASAWFLGHKLFFLSRVSTLACPLSFDLWTFGTSARSAVGDHLCRLSSRVKA